MALLVGVDGCPAGWLAVTWDDAAPGPDTVLIHRTARDLLAAHADAQVIAVDIPIGLANDARRQADVEARSLLGKRRSCVFDAPLRPALDAPSRLAAGLITKDLCGLGVSTQAWEMSHKVRDMDRAITPELQELCVEIHPELSFAMWNGGAPLPNAKKTDAGRRARATLIDARWPGCRTRLTAQLVERHPKKHWGHDDLNDALAALWSAERIARGTATRIPATTQVDERGLRCEIWT